MTVRPLLWLVLVAGITAGSLTDHVAERSPLRADGRVVLTADLHVHAFPGDGMLPVWELRKEATRRGLDVIAITNHNQLIAASLPVGGNREALPLLLPGQEVTSPYFHLAAVGVRRVVDWRLPLRQVVDDVHSQGGVAIAAHPLRESWRVTAVDALRALDGAEAVSRGADASRRNELREFFRRTRELNPSLAPIGSSDFHAVAPLGRCRTYIVADEISERGVLEAIRRGHTVASDGLDTLVGDPELVKLVQESGVRAMPSEDQGHEHQLAVLMVLGALLGLVCLK
jgi:PHP domain-containing protein